MQNTCKHAGSLATGLLRTQYSPQGVHADRSSAARRGWRLVAACALVAVLAAPTLAQLTPTDIAALRAQGEREGWSFTVGENQATQYALEDLCGLVMPPDWDTRPPAPETTGGRTIPLAYDWRDYDGCTPIKNQASCGSCWAFAAIGTMECAIKIVDGGDVDLSEQWLVSCCDEAGDCGGGWHTTAFDYLQCFGEKLDQCGDFGGVMEADFPYVAWNQPCGCPYLHPFCLDSWAEIGHLEETIKAAIYEHGPVATTVHVNSAFHAYTGGIFDGCGSGPINHAVVLVGWNDDEGVWIMRNSWGPGWGEDGYMRIIYNCNSIGFNSAYVAYSSSDCNDNGLLDHGEVTYGTSPDCNGNLMPDECDVADETSPDCNTNGVPDECDIASGVSRDCNGNRIPDLCDLASGFSLDCNGNGRPDSCEIASGAARDCNLNGIPDACDIATGFSADCNTNGVPDECDIGTGVSLDCNGNGIPDDCELAGDGLDCNDNGVLDECDFLPAFAEQSPPLTPLGDGYPQTYVLSAARPATGPVTLDFKAYGDLNFSTEIVDVYLNGVWIDQLFDADVVTYDCPAGAPNEDQTVLTAAEYNAAAETGTVAIEMIANYRVSPFFCTHPTWISVRVSYATEALSADCNANGIPDECDIAAERSIDANGNGIPDECELATCRGDCDCDGRITFQDITYFVAALGGYDAWVTHTLAMRDTLPDCPWANCDANGDTLVNFEDINPFVSLLGTPCP